MGFGWHVAQQACAQHGRERERDDRRNQNCHRERDGEFTKQAPHYIAHEEQWDQHRNERYRERNNRKGNLLGALERSLQWRFACFHIAGNIFHHHNSVVHHKACGNGERHQSEVVDGKARQVHHAKGAHQRERHRHTGNQRGRGTAQKQKHHHHHQTHRQQQLKLHVAHRSANRHRAVGQHLHVQRSGQIGLQLRQDFAYAVNRFNHVGPGLALDVQDHSGRCA